jgi:hypothetical protein
MALNVAGTKQDFGTSCWQLADKPLPPAPMHLAYLDQTTRAVANLNLRWRSPRGRFGRWPPGSADRRQSVLGRQGPKPCDTSIVETKSQSTAYLIEFVTGYRPYIDRQSACKQGTPVLPLRNILVWQTCSQLMLSMRPANPE